MTDQPSQPGPLDPDSAQSLAAMSDLERVRVNRVPGVRTVLVVLSSVGMVYDTESIRRKVLWFYPEAAVFFITSAGKPLGARAPQQIDLLIDFTGPSEREPLFFSRKLRRCARVAVGRHAGWFRRRIYDRVFEEKALHAVLPKDRLDRERFAQKSVLELAGIALVQAGDPTADRGKSIALELPPMLATFNPGT